MSKKKKKRYKLKKLPVFILLLIVLVSVLVFLYVKGADTRKLKGIGYNKEEIKLIKSNKIDIKVFDKYGYVNNISNILNHKDYEKDNLTRYFDLYDESKDLDLVIYIVNNNITYEYNDKLVSILKHKYFILKNLDRYMAYNSDNVDTTISMVNSNRDSEYYTSVNPTNTKDGLLMLVNKYYFLSKDYHYGELVTIEKDYSNNSDSLLNTEAYDAFRQLVVDSEKEGLHIRNNYAYRTYEYQDGVYNNYKKTGGEKYADSISARPGYSEHQTGLSLDVGVATKYSNDKFQNTKEYLWMKDNSYKYGFILRYPEGKENITGYSFEAWHYRYVGKEAAKFIYENDLTFEEYYAYYVNNK